MSDTWEGRMAARTREREQEHREAELAAIDALLPDDDAWLNGWPRDGAHVHIGTGIHCSGCGRLHGVICSAFPTDYDPPPEPRWPYSETDCPIPGCRDSTPTSTRCDAWDTWPQEES